MNWLRCLAWGLSAVTALLSGSAALADGLTLRIDYAFFNPLSLVIRDQHMLEQALGPDVEVQWVLSGTTSRALDTLRARSLDIGSSASAGAFYQRANGSAIKIVYVYDRPQWTALVVGANSPIRSVADLRGKRVATTVRTEPGIFLLKALADAGLTEGDITLVPLQDLNGRIALDLGNVDAWAGFDPFTAQAELETGDRLFFERPSFNSFGVVVTRESFMTAHADIVQKVVEAYDKARHWAADHNTELLQILGSDARISPTVAARQLGRVSFSDISVADGLQRSLSETGAVLKSNDLIPDGTDIDKTAGDLVDQSFVTALERHGGN